MTICCKPVRAAGHGALAGLAAIALIATASGAAAADKAASIEGVWKITRVEITGVNPVTVNNPQENLYIFSHGHFAGVAVTGEKARTAAPPPKDPARLTDADKLARYEEWAPLAAQAGTYAIKGDKLIRTATVAKAVIAVAAGPYEADMKLTGDTLVLTTKSQPGQPVRTQALTFTRVK